MLVEAITITGALALLSPVLTTTISKLTESEKHSSGIVLWGQSLSFLSAISGLTMVFFLRAANQPDIIFLNSIRFDLLAFAVLSIVFFIGLVITSFSERYLVAHEFRSSFCRGISILAVLASLMAVSTNLALTMLAWSGISIMLWRKMQSTSVHSSRPTKTVVFHHLASDLLFLGALSIIWLTVGSMEISQIAAKAVELTRPVSLASIELPFMVSDLVVLAFALSMSIKSALFPFHRWLLATLNAPTPLSGLLHAGVVNVSAIATARFWPILELSGMVLTAWAVFALISTMIGCLLMSCQTDVKRKLVYSTVGQMGFMCLQCACGLIPAAVFHLITHGLFKCHLFLITGSAVHEGEIKKQWNHGEDGSRRSSLGTLAGLVLALSLAVTVVNYMFDASTHASPVVLLFVSVAILSLFSIPAISKIGFKLSIAFAMIALPFMAASWVLSHSFEAVQNFHSDSLQIFTGCLAVMVALAVVEKVIKRSPLGKKLYVFALNDFYIPRLFSKIG